MVEIDEKRLAETLRAMNNALTAAAEHARRTGEALVTGSSPDDSVRVRVTRAGQVKRLRLHDAVLRRFDLAALGEVVTRTIRDTQLRARAAYDSALAELEPPDGATLETQLRRIWED